MTFDEANHAHPYDPTAKAEHLHGMAKLRAFKDPEWRRIIFDAMSQVEPAASRAWLDTSERRHP
jgi:hypothetical protein